MIRIEQPNNCCGCSACALACPKSCIKMQTDLEGFQYPEVDVILCVECGICEKVCPILHSCEKTGKIEIESYAAKNINETVREKSSSGGLFSVLAEYIISEGGAVFGAAFDDDFSVHHIMIDNVDDLEKLRGSKYLQSRIDETYIKAKELLKNGRKVFFTGTPCQVEALLSFLGRDYDNLYTQDLICHGTPSPLVWQKYLAYQEKQFSSKAKTVSFRNKANGWNKFSMQIKFENNNEYNVAELDDIFMKCFLNDFCLRPSCYECKFKKINRISDITLADFWGIENVYPEIYDDRGVSLVFVNSKKGKQLFELLKQKFVFIPTEFNKSIASNPSMVSSVCYPKERDLFFRMMSKKNFKYAVNKTYEKKHKRINKKNIIDKKKFRRNFKMVRHKLKKCLGVK